MKIKIKKKKKKKLCWNDRSSNFTFFIFYSESAPAVNKKPKKKRTSEISDLSFRSGGLKKSNDLDEPMEGRRTRGRKINYVEALASDSDEVCTCQLMEYCSFIVICLSESLLL